VLMLGYPRVLLPPQLVQSLVCVPVCGVNSRPGDVTPCNALPSMWVPNAGVFRQQGL
jgi:hypothetical protein